MVVRVLSYRLNLLVSPRGASFSSEMGHFRICLPCLMLSPLLMLRSSPCAVEWLSLLEEGTYIQQIKKKVSLAQTKHFMVGEGLLLV